METLKLYHRVPSSMEGDELFSLNQLKQQYPEIAENHTRKYLGREKLMQQVIPGTTWLWNDVIHFSPVHPQKVIDALVECGFSKKVSSKWFVVDPIEYDFNISNSIIYLHNKQKSVNEGFEHSEFEAYSQAEWLNHTSVPMITKQYYKSIIAEGGNPLMFGGIPHVLHHDSLSTDNLEIIEISS